MSEIKSTGTRKPKASLSADDYDQGTTDGEPLSLAEELADEAARGGDDTHDRYEQIKQGDIHIAELQRMTHAAVDRAGPQGKPDRDHRHQEAGSDLQDPQGAREAQRADVRRGDAGNPARRLRLPAQPRLPLPLLPRRHLRFAQPDSPLRPADRGHGFRADPPAEGKRTLLRAAAGRGHQLPGPEPADRKGLLRRPDAAAPRQAGDAGNDGPKKSRCAWST